MTLSDDLDVDENDLSPDEESESDEESSEQDDDRSAINDPAPNPSYPARAHLQNSHINDYSYANNQESDLPSNSLQACVKLPNRSDSTNRAARHEVQHDTSQLYSRQLDTLGSGQGCSVSREGPCVSSSGADHQRWELSRQLLGRNDQLSDPTLPINGANNVKRNSFEGNEGISTERSRQRNVQPIHPIASPTETEKKDNDDCDKNAEVDFDRDSDSDDDDHAVLIPKSNEWTKNEKPSHDLSVNKRVDVSSGPSSVAVINDQHNLGSGRINNRIREIGRTTTDELRKRQPPHLERKPKSLKPEERISKRKGIPKMASRNGQAFKASSFTSRAICQDPNLEFQQERSLGYQKKPTGVSQPGPSSRHPLIPCSTIHSNACVCSKCQGRPGRFQTPHQNEANKNQTTVVGTHAVGKSSRDEDRITGRRELNEGIQNRTTHVSAVISTAELNNVNSGNEFKPQPLRAQIKGEVPTQGPSQPPRGGHFPSQYSSCTQRPAFSTLYSNNKGSQPVPSSQYPNAFVNVPALPDPSTHVLHLNGSEYRPLQNNNTTARVPGPVKQVQPNSIVATNQLLHQSRQQQQIIRSSHNMRTVNGVPMARNIPHPAQLSASQLASGAVQRPRTWTEPQLESQYPHAQLHPHNPHHPHISGQHQQHMGYRQYLPQNPRDMNQHHTRATQGVTANSNMGSLQPSWSFPNVQQKTAPIQSGRGTNTIPPQMANAFSDVRKCSSLPQREFHETSYANNIPGNARQTNVVNGQRHISVNERTNVHQPVTNILPGQLPPCSMIVPHPLTHKQAERAQFNRNLTTALNHCSQPGPSSQPGSAFQGNCFTGLLGRLEKTQTPFPKSLMLAARVITYAAIEYRHYPFEFPYLQDHSVIHRYGLERAREIIISATVCSQLIQIQLNGVLLLEQQGFHQGVTDEWLFRCSSTDGFPLLLQLWQKKVNSPLNDLQDLKRILAVLIQIATIIKVVYNRQDEGTRNSLSVIEWLKQVARNINDQLERGVRH